MSHGQLVGFRSLTESAPPPSGNFGDFLRDIARARPHAPALMEERRQLSYAELDERCDRVAGLLTERGAEPGTRVALLFDNQLEVVELVFGAMRAGAVPVQLNPKLATADLRRIVAHSEATVLVVAEDQLERASALLGGQGPDGERGPGGERTNVSHVLVEAEDPPWGESYRQAIRAAPARFETVRVGPDDVSMQPYTSGSTGAPKGVLLTHGGTWWCVNMLRRVMLLEPSERALLAVPLYHKNGMLGAVKPFLMAGGSVVILRSFDAVGALRAIERFGVTYMTGVPAMYKLLLRALEANEFDLSSLEWGIVGSAAVPNDLFHDVERALGIRLVESYGITEGGPEVALTPRWGPRKPGWSGLVVPGVEIRIARPDDPSAVLAPDEKGELLVRSPGVARGYYRDPERTAGKFLPDGWLRTGDLAVTDEQGYLKIVGRIDDMINAGGEHVFPKEVEDLLLSHPQVRDVCVVPQPHDVKGEVPVAFVVLSRPDSAGEKDLKSWCLERGPAFAHPRSIYFREELPLGSTGKIDRARLKEEASTLEGAARGTE